MLASALSDTSVEVTAWPTDGAGVAHVLVAQTWFVIWFTDYCVQVHILQPWFQFSIVGIVHASVFQAIIFLICASHLAAMCTDPGSVKQNTVRQNGDGAAPPPPPLLTPRRWCYA